MSKGTFFGLLTLALMLVFAGIWIWAWSARRRRTFDRAAQLPLVEDDGKPPAHDRSVP
jgi:cytochrome c oxidase cbb3-type subunit 4